ncbi:MAG: adenylate/guanylate cyclase domain-containing protein [Rhizobiales bacterium]|nr:adenylate/guanylate cyclase domain-containing protein [Hyphomicrobiales bacterium]MDQ3560289.1 adenylate/guanylate cyclase domain-containing protein [Pseudomonadota bacterium]
MALVQPHAAPASPLFRGSVAQKARILSGLVLFIFVLTHLLNHSLGIWSMQAMDAVQGFRTAVTRSVPGTIVLLGAVVTHVALNLYKIARRTTWRMPLWEAVQIGLGLLIPLLLLPHATPMRAHFDIEGAATRYSETLPDLWNDLALEQIVLVIVVWIHGCIGLHYWLRLNGRYRRITPLLLALAVLIPTLALSGFVVAGREAAALQAASRDGAEREAATPSVYGGGDGAAGGAAISAAERIAQAKAAQVVETTIVATWLGWVLLAGVGIAVAARQVLNLRRRRIRVSYAAGPSVVARIGPTLLEISRMAGVPHASICGGRARCSTCRVKIEASARKLPAPHAAEAATLQRIRAEPSVRLACQIRPRGDISVIRLVRPPDERRGVVLAGADAAGVEQTLAVLFLDIRGFTSLSETRLPYDTVFLLNRFFGEIGEAIAGAGGWVDKYLGDGLMALFGLRQTPEEACHAALVAAMRIDAALDHVNALLGDEIAEPLRIGVGLHVGPLVLGRIGHSGSAATTVIGPPVNVASRLESLSKENNVQLVVSADLARMAGLEPGAFPETVVAVRGVAAPVPVLLIRRGRDLAPHLGLSQAHAAA